MRDFAVKERTSGDRAALWADGDLSDVVHKFRRAAVALRAVEYSADLSGDLRDVRLAQPRCGFDECFQHSLEIERRAGDDVEHIGGSGLLLEGLSQLIEQARVLDSDHSLFRKVVNKLDLFVSERADFLTINDNRADQLVFLKHGYSDVRPRAAQSDHWI